MISSDEYGAAGGDGDDTGGASDGSGGGPARDVCCARAIVAAKQTTTMAAIARLKAKTGVEAFMYRICRRAVDVGSACITLIKLTTN
jgi:hypothetical protein